MILLKILFCLYQVNMSRIILSTQVILSFIRWGSHFYRYICSLYYCPIGTGGCHPGFLLHKRNKPLCSRPLEVGSVKGTHTWSVIWDTLICEVHLSPLIGATCGCAVHSRCMWWLWPKPYFPKAIPPSIAMIPPYRQGKGGGALYMKCKISFK